MNWLTEAEVKEEAGSRKSALLCCKKHWEQLIKATKKDFEEFDECETDELDCKAYCSLCHRYFNNKNGNGICSRCPLKCRALWYDVNDAFIDMLEMDSPKSRKEFRKQAQRMLDKIDKTITRLYK